MPGSRSTVRSAATVSGSSCSGAPACSAATMACINRRWPASQRLKASLSCISSTRRSASAQRVVELHRRREAAQQRRHRLFVDVDEREAVAHVRQHQHARRAAGHRLALQPQRQRGAVARQQRQRHRNHERQLLALAGRGRAALAQAQRVGARRGVVVAVRQQRRRAGLRVPALERVEVLGQPAARVGVGDRLREVVAGHGLAVVALEVQVHAAPEALAAHQRVHHAHDLGAFFVHRAGVEVVDRGVATRGAPGAPSGRRLRRTAPRAGTARPGCA